MPEPSSQSPEATAFPEPPNPPALHRPARRPSRLLSIWGVMRNFSAIMHAIPPFRLKTLERIRQLLGIPAKQHQTRQPFELSKPLAKRVRRLDLKDSVRQVEKEGYGYIYNPAPQAFTERLKQAIVDIVESQPTNSAHLLLDKHPVFAEVVLNPKMLAMAEILCGKGALLSQLRCVVIGKDAPAEPLRVVQDWLPAPFPEHRQMITFCWACDDQSSECGAIRVVPKSHMQRRHPSDEEAAAAQDAIATECPAGSITFWDGSLWHSNWPRQAEGEQVVLFITYTRVALRPLECYDYLDDSWIAGKSFDMRVLLGREDGLGTELGALGSIDNISKLIRMMNWSKS